MTQADSVLSTPPTNTSATDDDLHTPESLQDALYRRTDVSPETFFQALGRVRRAARDEIERLIAWLDSTIDVDEDSATDDDPCDDTELERSLGSFDRMSNQITAWQGGICDIDAELDKCDDEESDEPEDGADSEPSLGSTTDGLYLGPDPGTIDCEGDEHDGREPGEDDEPSLGSVSSIDQTTWAAGSGDDLEHGTTRRIERPEPIPAPAFCNVTWPDGSKVELADIESKVVVIRS
jgi:hypothetical protein